MKRKPTAKSLRQGQTLYYLVPPFAHHKRTWMVGSLVVASDKLPDPEPDAIAPCPRRLLARLPRWSLAEFSYSRRAVEHLAKACNAFEEAARARRRARSQSLAASVERLSSAKVEVSDLKLFINGHQFMPMDFSGLSAGGDQ